MAHHGRRPRRGNLRRRVLHADQPTPRAAAYQAFFQPLLDDLREKHKFTNARVAQPQNWYSFAAGQSGFSYGASFALNRQVRVDLYIDRGDAGENKYILSWLHSQREQIEREFGEPLKWEPLDDKRASRVAAYRSGSIGDDEPVRTEIRDWMINRLLRMKKVLGSRIATYEPPVVPVGVSEDELR